MVDPLCARPGAAFGLIPVEVHPMALVGDVVVELRKADAVLGRVDISWEGELLLERDVLADKGVCQEATLCATPRCITLTRQSCGIPFGLGFSNELCIQCTRPGAQVLGVEMLKEAVSNKMKIVRVNGVTVESPEDVRQAIQGELTLVLGVE
eukprot:Hpha_TRINITY_DN23066_c0_g1::TRINITY_DN23066_c0_g1_i1::g.109305::m.109305